jgi:hypothetical protein
MLAASGLNDSSRVGRANPCQPGSSARGPPVIMAKIKASGRRYQGTSALTRTTGCPDATKSAGAVRITSGGRQTPARYHRVPTRQRIIRVPGDVTPSFPAKAHERNTAETAGPNVPQNTRIIGSIPSWGPKNPVPRVSGIPTRKGMRAR